VGEEVLTQETVALGLVVEAVEAVAQQPLPTVAVVEPLEMVLTFQTTVHLAQAPLLRA
jgi:hypothetical protein